MASGAGPTITINPSTANVLGNNQVEFLVPLSNSTANAMTVTVQLTAERLVGGTWESFPLSGSDWTTGSNGVQTAVVPAGGSLDFDQFGNLKLNGNALPAGTYRMRIFATSASLPQPVISYTNNFVK